MKYSVGSMIGWPFFWLLFFLPEFKSFPGSFSLSLFPTFFPNALSLTERKAFFVAFSPF